MPPPMQSTRVFSTTDMSVFNERADFQSITAMPQHQAYSFEELRLNDYKQTPSCVITHPSDTDSAFATYGLALARPYQMPAWFSLPTCRTVANSICHLGGAIIVFRAGKEVTEDFAIHEKLVLPDSEFVRLALSKDWKEAKDRVISLPEDEPDAVTLYQHFKYTRHIPSQTVSDAAKDAKELDLLVRAYILGERFMESMFKDAIIDAIIVKFVRTGRFDTRLTNLVYDNTPQNSPLRLLWLEIYVWAADPGWLDEKIVGDFINAEFTLDLSRYQMELHQSAAVVSSPKYVHLPCGFHEHVNEMCYRNAAAHS